MMKDPVCDMDVDETRTSLHSEYRGQTYFFCSEMCKEWFDKEPERFLLPSLPIAPRRKKLNNGQPRDTHDADEIQKRSEDTDI